MTAEEREQQPAQDPIGLVEMLQQLEDEGFSCNATALEGGDVRCGNCDQVSPVGQFERGLLQRTEGASDPGDMSAVVSLVCPRCGGRGVLVLRYGPEASLADSDTLLALEPT